MVPKMSACEKLSSDKAVIVTSIITIIVSLICVIIVATPSGRSDIEQEPEFMVSTPKPVNLKFSEADRKLEVSNVAVSRASAHKQLKLTTFTSFDEPVFQDDNVQLEFDSGPGHPLIDHVRNITVMKHVMVVQIPGHYYVYSGIFFKPDSSKPCKSLGKQIWDHNIVLIRDKATSGVIFNTTYTCCDECIEHKKTSYAGGIFHLLANDRLHVEVSSDGVISFRKEGSYFGLFLLD